MPSSGYFHTHPNLNEQLSPDQAELLSAFNSGEDVIAVPNAETGVILVNDDIPVSVQTVEEAINLQAERESNLGS